MKAQFSRLNYNISHDMFSMSGSLALSQLTTVRGFAQHSSAVLYAKFAPAMQAS